MDWEIAIMKWMGGWSYADLCEAPADVVDRIAEMMVIESEAARG